MRDEKKPATGDKAEYERPVLTRHGAFSRVTASQHTGSWNDGGGSRSRL